jgi:aryl-alcohol dehydrogenase-like predicted oxidoreductase
VDSRIRQLGNVSVGAIGLGAMPMSVRRHNVSEEQAIRTIHAGLDAGMTLIDTADAYAPDEHTVGHNERIVAKALASYGGDRSGVLVATKGGHIRVAGGSWDLDGRPEHLRRACQASLAALRVDAIGLYQLHRPDPKVPYAESVGALRELRDTGYIRLAGISNADVEQIAIARDVLGADGLASVQNEYSPRVRTSEAELRRCAEWGIAFLPWSPLGGMRSAAQLGGRHPAFAEIAAARGVSPQRVCLAWELAKAPVVIPIPGASRPESARDSAAAMDLQLTEEELARLG